MVWSTYVCSWKKSFKTSSGEAQKDTYGGLICEMQCDDGTQSEMTSLRVGFHKIQSQWRQQILQKDVGSVVGGNCCIVVVSVVAFSLY